MNVGLLIAAIMQTFSAAVVNIVDSFNRADGPIGLADSGQAWTTLSGTWAISGNAMQCVTASGNRDMIAIDLGRSDVTAQVKVLTVLAPQGMALRIVDNVNYIGVVNNANTTYVIFRVQANTATALATSTGVTPAAGDVLKAVLTGSTINVYLNANATPILTATETFNQTATKHGLYARNTTGVLFDDFSVT